MKLPLLAVIATLALCLSTAHAEKAPTRTETDPEAAQTEGAPDKAEKTPVAKGRSARRAEVEEDLSEDVAAMEKLRFMMTPGNYKCIGTVTPPGEQKSHPLTARVPVSSELDGLWQQVRYEENKTAEHPHPTKAIQFFTYDTVNKVFLRTSVDSLGRSINMTADNTDGERLTFTGHSSINGISLPTRLIWEKLGKDVKLGWEWSSGQGAWYRSVDLTCRR